MKLTREGGVLYTNAKQLIRLRPKYKPSGDRGRDTSSDLFGLTWQQATMTWDQLTKSWEQLI